MKREGGVPVIFAFTRRSLSRALKRSAKTSCVAVLSHDGASELFHAAVKRAGAARRQWEILSAFHAEQRGQPRRLLLRHLPSLGKQVPVDELQLQPLACALDDDE